MLRRNPSGKRTLRLNMWEVVRLVNQPAIAESSFPIEPREFQFPQRHFSGRRQTSPARDVDHSTIVREAIELFPETLTDEERSAALSQEILTTAVEVHA
jgi:hypothetical protein